MAPNLDISRFSHEPDEQKEEKNKNLVEKDEKNFIEVSDDQDKKTVPIFKYEKFADLTPDYSDFADLRNYTNVSITDRFQYWNFKYFDATMPIYMVKNIATISRKIFVQTHLPQDMLKDPSSDSQLPKIRYPRNKIRTTKYTPLNFIPKNLFIQFQNVANAYFLFVIILGAFQIFGVASPGLSAVPLIVIVCITAVRDAFEDSRRAILDTELNNSKIHLLTGLHNPNVVIEDVGLWRKFKKANTRFLSNVFNSMFRNKKKNAKKHSSDHKNPSKIQDDENNDVLSNNDSVVDNRFSMGESLNRIETRVSVDTNVVANNRLSMQSYNIANSTMKSSKPQPGTISDPNIYPSGEVQFRNKVWKDIVVGDIVRVRQNEEVPADIVIISTSHLEQNCYIETKNLDGETNLKNKNALKAGKGLKYGTDIERIKCWIECDSPNPNLYSFKGVMHYPNYQQTEQEKLESITIDNALFRGSTLRNTKWVIGIVLYTGSETKIMLNSGTTPTKKSRITKELNLSVYINFIFMFALCLVSGIINGIFYNKKTISRLYYEFQPYLESSAASGVVAFFVALILYQSLVPISLYISVEIIKTCQAYFIHSDVKMYHEKLDYPCIPKSWNISDDLGQVEYIFSDKTGTLTQNSMEFRKCSIGLKSYGESYTEAKMGMQKRMGIDVVKEKIKMDKFISDDKDEMFKLIKDNFKSFFNRTGKEQTFLQDLTEEDLTFVSSKYIKDVLVDSGHQKQLNEWFMTVLALCHTAITEDDPTNPLRKLIKAESPDESALVGVARDVGIEFRGKSVDELYLNIYGVEVCYKLLNTIPFNSTRKRMSVIVEVPKKQLPEYFDQRDNIADDETVAVLLCKGADNVIFERLSDSTDQEMLNKNALYLEQFSKEGLRTLCISYKILDEDFYIEWAERYHAANASIADNREEIIDEVAEKIEDDLTLIGCTAIEDRLQLGVPESIAILGQAGIKLWVLTGDKVETAINIGFSCNLLGSDMKLLVVDTKSDNENQEDSDASSSYSNNDMDDSRRSVYKCVNSRIDKFLREEFNIILNSKEEVDEAVAVAKLDHSAPNDKYAIILTGDVLTTVFDHANVTLQKKFLILCKSCKSVLCCRVSPAQKAQVVKIVKNNLDVMTLAIGDGANDVAMIQAANIGVGIAGEEGRQAVMSSDYGLGQFRFLTRLLLVHGRWSYKRLSEMIPCFFYKNVVFTLTLFWYSIYCDFDGTYLFEYTLIMFYNLAFTSLPVIFLGIFDQDVSDTISLIVPQLYISGILGLDWSQFKFIFYMIDGVYQSVLSFYFPYLLFYKAKFVNQTGLVLHHRFWMGTMVAIISAVSCNLYVLLQQKRWDWLSMIIYAFSILILFFWIGVWSSSEYSSGEYFKAASQVFGTTSFWAVFFLGMLCNLLPRFTIDTIRRLYFPKDIDIIREQVNKGDYDSYPVGYDPTDPKDVESWTKQKNSVAGSDISYSDNKNSDGSAEGAANSDAEPFPVTLKKNPTLKESLKHPIGSIRRKLTITKRKKEAHLLDIPGVSPIHRLRMNMAERGEYVGDNTSDVSHHVEGLIQAENLVAIHSRRSMSREATR